MDKSSSPVIPHRKPGEPITVEFIRERTTVTEDGCWEWLAHRTEKGYGSLSVNRAPRRVHRIIYELIHGEIPDGIVIRHTCDNPPCCNPEHLLAGTPKQNTHDMMERGRHRSGGSLETCGRGHPFTPENTYIRKNGTRMCRECRRLIESSPEFIEGRKRRDRERYWNAKLG